MSAADLIASSANGVRVLFLRALPTDFKASLLEAAQDEGLTTKAWQPGSVVRTMLATLAAAMGMGFGVVGTQQLADLRIVVDGYMATFAAGGLLRLASAVTPDPSVRLPDGTYPPIRGFLDSIADGIFNVQRSGGPNGGPSVQSNASLVAECLAKLTMWGVELAEDDVDPYVYYATDGYDGDTLTDAIARAKVVITAGRVDLYLATATGIPSSGDVTKVHDFIQRTCVPWSITGIVHPSAAVSTAYAATVYVPARYASQAAVAVQTAVTDFINSVPIGGNPGLPSSASGVAIAAIVAAIVAALPYVSDVEDSTINGVASDLALSATAVAVPVAPAITVVST